MELAKIESTLSTSHALEGDNKLQYNTHLQLSKKISPISKNMQQ